MAEEKRINHRKVRTGTVVSDKGDKSITVLIERVIRHPMYEKTFRVTKKYAAHDEKNEAGKGDTVKIMESRPISKTKNWRLLEILERAE